ncbi:MAG: hypothetical protein JEZ06_17090 [Anaerolineaceae bacterium]|nr:hypothetical protein [Anaerolineaceae bacterium]
MFDAIPRLDTVFTQNVYSQANFRDFGEINAVNPTDPVQSIRATDIVHGLKETAQQFPVSFVANSKIPTARVIDLTSEPVQQSEIKSESDWELSEEDKELLRELKVIDRKVQAHERAHQAAGGELIRKGASYSYKIGPDGQRYAVSGEVAIDTSEVPDDPKATLTKAERVIRAALAPVDPSSTDRQVAAKAASMAAEARRDIAQEVYQSTTSEGQYSNLEPALNFPI